jgi:hypothetical protein
MGRHFKKREYRYWTEPEIEKLRNGQIPEGRTYVQCCAKADLLGFPRPDSPTGRHKWTKEDLETMKSGKVPPGRTATACITKGYGLGYRVADLGNGNLQVESMRDETPSEVATMTKAALLSKMRDEGLTYPQIAELAGISKQYACDLVNRYRRSARYAAKKAKSGNRVEDLIRKFNEARKR